MRTTTAAAAIGVAALLTTPAHAAGTTGPFAGVVRQGAANVHAFDNNPSGQPCIDLATTYRVQLTHAPVTDRLTLSVGTLSVMSTRGGASLTFWSGVCTQFDITVTGTSVDDQAAYAVTVTRPALNDAWLDVAVGD